MVFVDRRLPGTKYNESNPRLLESTLDDTSLLNSDTVAATVLWDGAKAKTSTPEVSSCTEVKGERACSLLEELLVVTLDDRSVLLPLPGLPVGRFLPDVCSFFRTPRITWLRISWRWDSLWILRLATDLRSSCWLTKMKGRALPGCDTFEDLRSSGVPSHGLSDY